MRSSPLQAAWLLVWQPPCRLGSRGFPPAFAGAKGRGNDDSKRHSRASGNPYSVDRRRTRSHGHGRRNSLRDSGGRFPDRGRLSRKSIDSRTTSLARALSGHGCGPTAPTRRGLRRRPRRPPVRFRAPRPPSLRCGCARRCRVRRRRSCRRRSCRSGPRW